jgi:protein-L-isoaspartate(D-aspartate) O-methyltransferase
VRVRILCLGLIFSSLGVWVRGDDLFESRRRRMVRAIEADVALTSQEIGRKRLDPAVMEVMGKVLRHEFVPARVLRYAYDNRPLPIGFGQTISQPYIVALMTDLLDLEPDDRVLEVGTGSGYQAAVLAELVTNVYTIEIIPELGEAAEARLARLGYENISTRVADGYHGWQEEGPFDGILVAAAASHVPPPLVQQLKPGAKMILPVGGPFTVQHLMLVSKLKGGGVQTRQVLPVAFVPLTGDH